MTTDERRRFRALVRSTHPDAGGDHDAFVSAMARWPEHTAPATTAPDPAPSGGSANANLRFHHRSTPLEQVIAGALTLIRFPARTRRTS